MFLEPPALMCEGVLSADDSSRPIPAIRNKPTPPSAPWGASQPTTIVAEGGVEAERRAGGEGLSDDRTRAEGKAQAEAEAWVTRFAGLTSPLAAREGPPLSIRPISPPGLTEPAHAQHRRHEVTPYPPSARPALPKRPPCRGKPGSPAALAQQECVASAHPTCRGREAPPPPELLHRWAPTTMSTG